MDKIEKLRQKPENTRKQIALASTVVITGIIVMFWMYTLGERFNTNSNKVSKQDSSEKPLNILIGSVGGISSDLKASVSDVFSDKN